ncbi:zinc-binding dehydrogenase [Limosilactobacillus fermentum]|uniref:zinc-binding dehydrogenase n=1 Tax=Limosilactobacillus fermentum TaxID=1613 RepID=UPI001CB76E4E|nr:zinc-binding dehydrogenase [Limosilactobacillus fermentum]
MANQVLQPTRFDEHNIVKVPDDADVDLAYLGPLGCGLQTGSGSVLNYLKPEPGATIAIFGMGPVGLSAVMGAKIAEASRILVFDLNDQRLAMAKELGATDVFNGKDIDVETTVKELIPGGIDYSLDTTGNRERVRDQKRHPHSPPGRNLCFDRDRRRHPNQRHERPAGRIQEARRGR